MRAALLLLALAACAEFPTLDARLAAADLTVPSPALVPLGDLLAQADAQAAPPPPAPQARAGALAARAAALRGAVLTEADRARLGETPSLQ